jgi:1-acyl-sn-glycerol-3-phosphate acyltransferase
MTKALSVVRSILYVAYMAITVIPWGAVVCICSPFLSKDSVYVWCVNWVKLAHYGSRWICGVQRRVIGMENLPTAEQATEAVILASKHQSTWETFALPAVMPHPLAYVFKKELLYIPFFGWAMSRLDMIHIDRSRRAEAWNKVAEQGKRLSKLGKWVIMFPEGTRTPRGSQGTYKAGATRLAIAVGVPVVPIAVDSARCWPRKSFWLTPGVVTISIGKPISAQGREPDEMMREVEAWIEAEMRRLDPEAYARAPA